MGKRLFTPKGCLRAKDAKIMHAKNAEGIHAKGAKIYAMGAEVYTQRTQRFTQRARRGYTQRTRRFNAKGAKGMHAKGAKGMHAKNAKIIHAKNAVVYAQRTQRFTQRVRRGWKGGAGRDFFTRLSRSIPASEVLFPPAAGRFHQCGAPVFAARRRAHRPKRFSY